METEPLLFVSGPPVYRHHKKVKEWIEESTSIFPERQLEVEVKTESIMWKRLNYFTSPFAQHVYRPLTFQMKYGESLQGLVEKLEDESATLRLVDGTIVSIDMNDIHEINWRGKPFPVRFR
ncbi:MAG: hypothetical protein ABWX61_00765 [Paenisporosarcina sp.]